MKILPIDGLELLFQLKKANLEHATISMEMGFGNSYISNCTAKGAISEYAARYLETNYGIGRSYVTAKGKPYSKYRDKSEVSSTALSALLKEKGYSQTTASTIIECDLRHVGNTGFLPNLSLKMLESEFGITYDQIKPGAAVHVTKTTETKHSESKKSHDNFDFVIEEMRQERAKQSMELMEINKTLHTIGNLLTQVLEKLDKPKTFVKRTLE